MDYLRDKSSLAPGEVTLNAAKELVYELDRHLAAHSVLFHQYLKHAWLVPPELSSLLQSQSADVLVQLEALGHNIVWLGGVPIGGLCEHENLSYLECEREGLYSLKAMLARSATYEETVIFRLNITVETAQALEVPRTEAVLRRAREAAEGRGKRLREVRLE